jgi:hypothetical protein
MRGYLAKPSVHKLRGGGVGRADRNTEMANHNSTLHIYVKVRLPPPSLQAPPPPHPKITIQQNLPTRKPFLLGRISTKECTHPAHAIIFYFKNFLWFRI